MCFFTAARSLGQPSSTHSRLRSTCEPFTSQLTSPSRGSTFSTNRFTSSSRDSSGSPSGRCACASDASSRRSARNVLASSRAVCMQCEA